MVPGSLPFPSPWHRTQILAHPRCSKQNMFVELNWPQWRDHRVTSHGSPCWVSISDFSHITDLLWASVSLPTSWLKKGNSHYYGLPWWWSAWLGCSQILHKRNLELVLILGWSKRKKEKRFNLSFLFLLFIFPEKDYLENEEKQKEKEKKITHSPITQTEVLKCWRIFV